MELDEILASLWNDDYTDDLFYVVKRWHIKPYLNLSIIKERDQGYGRSALPHYVFIVEDSDLLENERIVSIFTMDHQNWRFNIF